VETFCFLWGKKR